MAGRHRRGFSRGVNYYMDGTMSPEMELIDYAPGFLQARRASGLSQKQLAARIGTTFSYVSRVERGVRFPSFAYLVEFSKALGMPLSELLALGEELHRPLDDESPPR